MGDAAQHGSNDQDYHVSLELFSAKYTSSSGLDGSSGLTGDVAGMLLGAVLGGSAVFVCGGILYLSRRRRAKAAHK